MVARAGAGKDAGPLLKGKLHREAADTAASPRDEQGLPVQVRQLGQCLPGGEAGAGERGGRLVAQGIGHRHQGASRHQGVAGKAAAVAQVGVIGDPGAGAQVGDIGPQCHQGAHAIDAGHMAWLPVGMTLFDEFPVHRIEGDDPVGDEDLVGPGGGERLPGEDELVRFAGGVPAPGLGMVHGDSLKERGAD